MHLHIFANGHSLGPIDNIMDVRHISPKGPYIDTMC